MTVASCLRRGLTVMFFVSAVAWSSHAAAQSIAPSNDPKLDSSVRATLTAGARRQRVIISVRSDARPSLVNALRARGNVVKRIHRFVGAVSAEVGSNDIEALSNNPSITHISADGAVRATASGFR